MVGLQLTSAALSGLPVVVEVNYEGVFATFVGKVDFYDPSDGRVAITEADGNVARVYASSIVEVRYA